MTVDPELRRLHNELHDVCFRLQIEKGALKIQDGWTSTKSEKKSYELYRGVHGVERIVIVNPSGSVTFDVLRWCQDQSIAIDVLDDDGDVVFTGLGAKETVDVAIRRAQYEAATNGRDLLIAKWLLSEKLRKQIKVLESVADAPVDTTKRKGIRRSGFGSRKVACDVAETLREVLHSVPDVTTMDTLRGFEGRTSGNYYLAFEDIPLTWKVRDKKLILPHWLVVGPRISPLSRNARRAVTPANCIRNIAFAALATVCRLAAAVAGLDVRCGFMHADRGLPDNLVYDLMEPYRPVVDYQVLHLLDATVFSYGDFVLATDGQCRAHDDLAKHVAATCSPTWHEIALEPVIALLLRESTVYTEEEDA